MLNDGSTSSLGVALAVVGVILWIGALVADAGPVATIVPILMVTGGAAQLSQTARSETAPNDASPTPHDH